MSTLVNAQASQSKTQKHASDVVFTLFSLAQENVSGIELYWLAWLGRQLSEVLIVSILVKQASCSRIQKPRCAHLVFDHEGLVMLLTMFFAPFSLAQENAGSEARS